MVLLPTALVRLQAQNGQSVVARAILDSAAQATFITEHIAQVLNLKRSHCTNRSVSGISATPTQARGTSILSVVTLDDEVIVKNHEVVLLRKIIGDLPQVPLPKQVKQRTQLLRLADPQFDTPAPVDVLIGADLFPKIVVGGALDLGPSMPKALRTRLGFTIIGPTLLEKRLSAGNSSSSLDSLLITEDLDLHKQLQQFWRIEEPPPSTKRSKEDEECEEHFRTTHTRNDSGRYITRLPLKGDISKLGDSSAPARRQFISLERRFQKNPAFRHAYSEFMSDYISSGHMHPVDAQEVHQSPCYFLPHHGVFRNDKIRVVFNASAETSNGTSLNAMLHAGPKLHNDITNLITHFRRFPVVFTCDIRQMFRQILIHPEDRNLQLIYWRKDQAQPLETYKLATVTYGMASSPYLANRVIAQLITDEGDKFPRAAAALKEQIFVDDCLLGHNSIEQALQLKEEVTALMAAGGFELRKWSSSHPELLASIPEEFQEPPKFFDDTEAPLYNILGLCWNQETDHFLYKVSTPKGSPTKRTVLSCIARLFDPMGWLCPVILWAKALLQKLWTLTLDWDSPLPLELEGIWNQYVSELDSLSEIRIPRHLEFISSTRIELHGFCDASEIGYAACIYLRTQAVDGSFNVKLLIAKSKVAPLKRISVPRLELCGAHLLARLLACATSSLNAACTLHSTTAWADSSVVLSWINTPPYKLKTFVANRISEIHDWTPPATWKHVSSANNPADTASRGILPSLLRDHPLWWQGPPWLLSDDALWPPSTFSLVPLDSLEEVKGSSLHALLSPMEPPRTLELFSQYSSWTTLVRIVSLLLRFRHNTSAKPKKLGPLTSSDLREATQRLWKIVQAECFSDVIASLEAGKLASPTIQRLNPFLDASGLIRVGGRLKNAQLKYEARHPILLPKKHPAVTLLVEFYHQKFLHAGPQLLQAHLSQQYWILSSRSLIRSVVFKCIRCFKSRPKLAQHLMGDLPLNRTQPSSAFQSTGIDYAGPFLVRPHSLRRVQHVKAYLCLFICFSTKAVHLEMVSDLTSEAYLAALARFVSRRGLPSDLYSDCGTNLVGAARALERQFSQLAQEEKFTRYVATNHITFHFIPPRAPHHGGLWERAVRSAKEHLKRVVGEQILTSEEFQTLLAKVEAILNSRPLTPLSSDPSDLSALTPGHFLIGRPLLALPEPDWTEVPLNRLRRWQMVQRFSQHIWSRWQKEYLHTLQQRPKWTKPKKNLEVGDLVLIAEDNTPPLAWKMGRIIEVCPGDDGTVRVVKLRTSQGTLTRPVVKLSPLPLD